jgi:hypothetical protein
VPRKPVHTQRMLLLMRHCIDTGIVKTEKEWFTSVGAGNNNSSHIKRGTRSFTIHQLIRACKRYKVNMNWLCGLSEQMSLVNGKSAITLLREAVKAVEAQQK